MSTCTVVTIDNFDSLWLTTNQCGQNTDFCGVQYIFSSSTCIAVDNASELLVSLSSGNLEEYYPSAAIASLMKILKDPSLSQHHTMVIQVHTKLQCTCMYYTQCHTGTLHQ